METVIGSKDFVKKTLAKKMHQKYINEYNKQNYAIISFRVKKDESYYRFKELLKNNDISIASFFKDIISEFLEMDYKSK